MSDAKAFTGRKRQRRTKRSVWLLDRAAKWSIIVGGIGTIAVVSTVALFLAYIALPLFFNAGIEPGAPRTAPWGSTTPVAVGADDQQHVGWALLPDGRMQVFRLDDEAGDVVSEEKPLGDVAPTAFSKFAGTAEFLACFADGSLQRGKINTVRTVLDPATLPATIQALAVGQAAVHDGALVRHSDSGEFQSVRIEVAVEPRIAATVASPIVLADQSPRPGGPVLCTFSADRKLRVHSVDSQRDRATGKTRSTLLSTEITYAPRADGSVPKHLLVSGVGDNVFLVWEDGRLQRFDVALPTHGPVEELDLVPEPEARVTALTAMIGKSTIVVGDSLGRIRGWFRVKPEGLNTADGSQLVAAHELSAGPAAVASLAPSTASRLLGVGYEDGRVRLFNMTNERLLADCEPQVAARVTTVAVAPRDNGLLAVAGGRTERWEMKASFLSGTWHPDLSLASLFGKVWYEGENEPKYVWQTSSASDSYEPKFSFLPLIFGTFKATFYSLLFGVPIALLAALYTSEFLPPRWKSVVKPTVELMAGLPSVVLGFIAALVLAPVVERMIPTILAAVVVVPTALIVGAQLWQLVPRGTRLTWEHYRFWLITAVLLAAPLLAAGVGPLLERVLFAGDIKAWLAGGVGSAVGGWVMMLFPLAAGAVGYVFINRVMPRVRGRLQNHGEFAGQLISLGAVLIGFAAAATVAWLGGLLLASLGCDPRGSLIGGYEQRNTLIVSFAMGFAVVPIIFTIAEDALSTVPSHLRSASLGAGATKWQTALRIVVPTAMSGLFSAVMVGMGRAVGETMIVLMAAGNTPIVDMNIFNGFRSLSANIAVELPEAVPYSSHYRVLFLSALVLFVLTFALNTAAELVRQRFRRRAYQL